jgi:hypothetical protein
MKAWTVSGHRQSSSANRIRGTEIRITHRPFDTLDSDLGTIDNVGHKTHGLRKWSAPTRCRLTYRNLLEARQIDASIGRLPGGSSGARSGGNVLMTRRIHVDTRPKAEEGSPGNRQSRERDLRPISTQFVV